MKKEFQIFTLLLCLLFSSCSTDLYDYDELNNRIDKLEERLNALNVWSKEINTNIYSLKSLIDANCEEDVITAVTPILSENMVVGYTVSFLNSLPITIYHDANDMSDEVSKEGYAPSIGVKLDEDSIYYWTLDDKWLLDDNQYKIKVHEGVSDSGESDVVVGAIPKLKVENGCWYLSLNNGQTWARISDERATIGNNIFKNVKVNDDNVAFILNDNSEIYLPIYQEIDIVFDLEEYITGVEAGQVISIPYKLLNATEKTQITISSDGIYKAEVVTTDLFEGKIVVTVPAVYEDGHINVHLNSGYGYSTFYVIKFCQQQISSKLMSL